MPRMTRCVGMPASWRSTVTEHDAQFIASLVRAALDDTMLRLKIDLGTHFPTQAILNAVEPAVKEAAKLMNAADRRYAA